jgi:hypothetical protein
MARSTVSLAAALRRTVSLAAALRPTVSLAAALRPTLSLAALAAAIVACAGGARDLGSTLDGVPACPRDATQDASGRCACADGTLSVFGACVAPAAADAFCGPGARMSEGGCSFRTCAANESIDVGTGACVSRAALANFGEPCAPPSLDVFDEGRRSCVPGAAACPRGTRRRGNACVGPTRCPPGSLTDGSACRPVVLEDPRSGRRRVDVGAWSVLALGVDGGPGSPEVCQPLELRPGAFDASQGEVEVRLRVVLSIPDEDVSRLHADVEASDTAGRRLTSAAAQSLARQTVTSILELLRGLGGESTAAAVTVEFRCDVGPARGDAGAKE